MSQLELKRTNMKVKIYGDEYDLRKPSVKEMEDFGERANAMADDPKSLTLMKELVVSLGMPSDLIEKMEFDHFVELCNYLTGAKKN
jgi:hypothetical protein